MTAPLPLPLGRVLVIGAGDVTRNRLRPALHALGEALPIERLVYLDLAASAPFELAPRESYLPVEAGSRLPLAALTRQGLLGPGTLAVVATPTAHHAGYAAQLAPYPVRLAVEKPLTDCPLTARRLLAVGGRLLPMSHFLFKSEMQQWLHRARRHGLPWLRSCVRLEVDLLESQGVGRRRIDPAVTDLGWHALEVILAPLRAAGRRPVAELGAVRAATYRARAGEPAPTTATAARVNGTVRAGGRAWPFVARVGKGLGVDRKELRYTLRDGEVLTVDLSESGPAAHGRLLRELLTAEEPAMGLSLAGAVQLVGLCREAERQARHEGPYPFGEAPAFLADAPSPALLGLYL